MNDFSVNIVGCGSATPSRRHNPSAQVVNHQGRLFMVDCGEGTQQQLRRMKIGFSDIRHIFISHLHGDHLLGLPGLLSTLSLQGTTGQVHVYIFEEGAKWLEDFARISRHHATLDVVYHIIKREKALLYEDDKLTVESFPLYHGVPCVGYLFREKPKKRRIIGDMVEYHKVPLYMRPALKDGADFVNPEGVVIPNSALTLPPPPSASYAYCSDTVCSDAVAEAVKGVDLLYHEATYGDDKADKARERGHSTARQAASVALKAGAKKLVIGHYSKSYPDYAPLLEQAREVFPATIAADEGMQIPVS